MAVDMTLYPFDRVADNGLFLLESSESKKGDRVASAEQRTKVRMTCALYSKL